MANYSIHHQAQRKHLSLNNYSDCYHDGFAWVFFVVVYLGDVCTSSDRMYRYLPCYLVAHTKNTEDQMDTAYTT